MLVEVLFVKVKWAQLIGRLEDVWKLVVIDLVPHHNSVEMLYEGVFNMKPIPPLLVAIVLESEILNIEELVRFRIDVD